MKTKAKKSVICALFALFLSVCVLFGVSLTKRNEKAQAATGNSVTLTIQSNNLSYSDCIYMLYAVSVEGVDFTQNPIKMLFWENAKASQDEYAFGTQAYSVTSSGTTTVNGKQCLVFYSSGVAAKEMTDNLYARAYAEVDGTAYYSDLSKCSVLEYVYTMREKGNLSAEQETAFSAMLNYGAAMQTLLQYNTSRPATATYYKISVENGTLADGTTTGRYLANEKVTLTANAPLDGWQFSHWTDELGSTVQGNEITVTTSKTYTAVYKEIAEEQPTVQEKTVSWTAGAHTGTQYANETYVINDDLTIFGSQCHFTTELRIYDSTSHPGFATMQYSGAVSSLTFNMGYTKANLLVYGSTDGSTWESVGSIALTTTSYIDYTLDVDETKGYTHIKLDASGGQIRVAKIDAVILTADTPATPPAEEDPVTPPVTPPTEYTDELKIYFPSFQNKVSGDCTLIKVGNTEVLIDAGSAKGSEDVIVPYIQQYCTDGVLEYVIATHAHEDHIASFVGENGVFASFQCQTIIDFPQTKATSQVYNDYVSYRNAEVTAGATHYTALECWNQSNGAKQSYSLGNNVTLNILYQEYYKTTTNNENNFSVCTLVSYGEKHFLFTGDLEEDGEASLLANNDLPVCELFKSGHHGSNTANSAALLKKIQPKKVIITCCCGDKHGFPHQETIDTIALYTTEVYVPTLATTSGYELLNGNITVTCDGTTTTVTGSNHSLLFKDTDWFKKNRTTPSAWQ